MLTKKRFCDIYIYADSVIFHTLRDGLTIADNGTLAIEAAAINYASDREINVGGGTYSGANLLNQQWYGSVSLLQIYNYTVEVK